MHRVGQGSRQLWSYRVLWSYVSTRELLEQHRLSSSSRSQHCRLCEYVSLSLSLSLSLARARAHTIESTQDLAQSNQTPNNSNQLTNQLKFMNEWENSSTLQCEEGSSIVGHFWSSTRRHTRTTSSSHTGSSFDGGASLGRGSD